MREIRLICMYDVCARALILLRESPNLLFKIQTYCGVFRNARPLILSRESRNLRFSLPLFVIPLIGVAFRTILIPMSKNQ